MKPTLILLPQRPLAMFQGSWAQQSSMPLQILTLAIFVVAMLVFGPQNLLSVSAYFIPTVLEQSRGRYGRLLQKRNIAWLEILPTCLRDRAFSLAYLNNGAKVIEHRYREVELRSQLR